MCVAFGKTLKKAGSSHVQLSSWYAKLFGDLAARPEAQQMIDLMSQIKTRVVDYRSKFIEHLDGESVEERVVYGRRGRVRLSSRRLEGDEGPVESKDAMELIELLRRYRSSVLAFVEMAIPELADPQVP